MQRASWSLDKQLPPATLNESYSLTAYIAIVVTNMSVQSNLATMSNYRRRQVLFSHV